ncbi:sensor histidine kinase [Halostagnicola bangensis]
MTSEERQSKRYAIDPQLSAREGLFCQTLVANTSEGLLTIDRESEIVFANAAIEDILGYRPEELVGSSKLEIIPERLRDVHKRRLEAYIECGDKSIDWNGVELPALHKAGHEVPVAISLKEHEFEGKLLFTGVFRDISENKQQELQLERQNEQLENFARVLSHDLQSPLNVAKGYTNILEENLRREEISEIAESLDRMERLIQNTLKLAQQGATVGEKESLSLEQVATESWQWVDTDSAELSFADGLGSTRADRNRLNSLLENLFTNAVKHGGADITVTIGMLDDADGFYVEDDGDGIPEQRHQSVFEHGYTTSSDGTGLGLSIVEGVATAHEWEITITDSSAGGVRFEFRT